METYRLKAAAHLQSIFFDHQTHLCSRLIDGFAGLPWRVFWSPRCPRFGRRAPGSPAQRGVLGHEGGGPEEAARDTAQHLRTEGEGLGGPLAQALSGFLADCTEYQRYTPAAEFLCFLATKGFCQASMLQAFPRCPHLTGMKTCSVQDTGFAYGRRAAIVQFAADTV